MTSGESFKSDNQRDKRWKQGGNKEESWKEVFKYSAWDRGNWLRSCYFRELRCHEARIGKIRRWADAERNKTATMEKARNEEEKLISSWFRNVIYIGHEKYSNIWRSIQIARIILKKNTKNIHYIIIIYNTHSDRIS